MFLHQFDQLLVVLVVLVVLVRLPWVRTITIGNTKIAFAPKKERRQIAAAAASA